MGYYSNFEIESDPPLDIATLSEGYHIPMRRGYASEGDIKWYEWETEMAVISDTFPDHLFTVTRTGEESPDIEFAYFKGGQFYSVKPEIKAPPFDPSKLRPPKRW